MSDVNSLRDLVLVKEEIERIEADLRLLKSTVEQYEQAENIVEKLHTDSQLSNAAARIREKRLLCDRSNYHILQVSPRRYSVIKLTCVLGQEYSEFEIVKPGLEWQDAQLIVECQNSRIP